MKSERGSRNQCVSLDAACMYMCVYFHASVCVSVYLRARCVYVCPHTCLSLARLLFPAALGLFIAPREERGCRRECGCVCVCV